MHNGATWMICPSVPSLPGIHPSKFRTRVEPWDRMNRPSDFICSKATEPAEMTPAGSHALARAHVCTSGASHVHELASSPARCRICGCILHRNVREMISRRGAGQRGTQSSGKAGSAPGVSVRARACVHAAGMVSQAERTPHVSH